MSYAFNSRLGEQLYQLLPEVYRTRDKKARQVGGGSGTEDLAKYLDAHGHLLDLIHATLKQQFDDALPDSSQDWLLSYFAQLLAANIVSPDSDGRRAEIKHAVSWRQRKGTLKCAEEIAEAVGQMEVEIQEGWKRVAMTPRIGMPLMPLEAWDATLKNIDMTIPSEAARHPALPAAMVDLRRPSRAVEALSTNPAARTSNFRGVIQTWRQTNRHGVPCFRDSFDDVSRRTVDIRTPDAVNGHYHHKRLLAYAPPPAGLFPFDPLIRTWDKALQENFIKVKHESGVLVYSNSTERILVIHKTTEGASNDKIELEAGKNYRIENIHFSGTLLLTKGQLELQRVEAGKVQVDTFSTDEPVMIAENCLFNVLSVGAGTAKLDSCTILDKAILKDVDTVNCIFNDFEYNGDVLITGEVRYSRIPSSLYDHIQDKKQLKKCTTKALGVFATIISYKVGIRDNNGAGVLRPDCDPSIYAGASDGGEMGYFHHGREGRPVRIKGDQILGKGGHSLEDIIFEDAVKADGGKLVLIRSAAKSLTVNTALSFDTNDEVIPALAAKDCLFDDLTVAAEGLARLEYCTVMDKADCKHLQASDCIFAGSIINVEEPPSFLNCIRYSNIPVGLDDNVANALRLMDDSNKIAPGSNTLETPVFHDFDYCTEDNGDWEFIRKSAEFGDPGYGVLAPVTPDAVRFGAEDRGEMGAYHHKYYSLKVEAVLDKMREFLPVGIEPVLIQDTRLLRVPPETKNLSNGGTS